MRANPEEVPHHPACNCFERRKRQLVVNADDFGFTPDVNEGIVEAHRRGILTATTLMANGDAFDDAIACARETPSLDIGCHLVLIGGQSLLTGQHFPHKRHAIGCALARRDIRPYDELARANSTRSGRRHPAYASRYAQAHPPRPACARRRRAALGGVRHPLGAPPLRFSAEHDARRGSELKRMTSNALGLLRAPRAPCAQKPRLPHDRSLRRIPDHRPLPCAELVELHARSCPKAARNLCATLAAAGRPCAQRAPA